MKKGYFDLGFLLVAVGLAAFVWLERSRERRETLEAAMDLQNYLADRLAAEAYVHQAFKDAEQIEHYLRSGGSTIIVVAFTGMALQALIQFMRTELFSTMKAKFIRIWTWRP